jgi:hypothetical protein
VSAAAPAAPAEPLSAGELKLVRSIVRGFTGDEWRVLKAIASAIVAARGGRSASSSNGASGAEAASDADLLSPYGDPSIRRDPKRWAGPSYVGAKYSECPTDYLVMLADSFEYGAGKDSQKPEAEQKKHRNGTPFWKYNLQDAKRARGWARRNLGIAKPPPAARPEHVVEPDMVADELAAEEPAIQEEYLVDDELMGRM